jgi:protein-S-isoprenylcysteine O-methyltransferase Ste14
MTIFKLLFLLGLILAELTRWPHRRARRADRVKDNRVQGSERVLLLLILGGLWAIPLVYIFTPWLDVADYDLPAWPGWIGVVLLAVSLWLRWRAMADLSRNWSSTLLIREEHSLVTRGVYRYVRHPIYAAVWLSVIAQALMLHNWIAGLSGLICFLPVYGVRVPREERMMLDHFGETYRAYSEQVGRIIPRWHVR